MLDRGTTLRSRYRIEGILGDGSMGCVYLATDSRLNRPVAVKQLHIPFLEEDARIQAVRQFHSEARLLSQLKHENLVEVCDHFEESDLHYLVTSYVDGTSLMAVVRDASHPLPLGKVLAWVLSLCDVLEYLHTRRPPILFRDLKPENCLLDGQGKIHLIDFGLSREMPDGSQTTTFIRCAGTPGFAPLEQLGGGTDERSDIYALGATAYTLLTRQVPESAYRLQSRQARWTPPSSLNPHVTPDLDGVILKMMALRREDRYPSAVEARRAILSLVGSGE